MSAQTPKFKRRNQGLAALFALALSLMLAACGARPNEGYAPLAATPKVTPEEAAKAQANAKSRLKLVRTTLLNADEEKSEVYRILDVSFGADAAAHIINAEITVASSAGTETINLAGKIRENGSATLLDLSPRKDSKNGDGSQRLVAEAYCVDFETCEKIILNVWYKVGKEDRKRQFVSDELEKSSKATAEAMPGAATPKKDVKPVKPEASASDDDGDDSLDHGDGDSEPDTEWGEFVGSPRNEEYIEKLWDRPVVPEPVVETVKEPVDLENVVKDLPTLPTMPDDIDPKDRVDQQRPVTKPVEKPAVKTETKLDKKSADTTKKTVGGISGPVREKYGPVWDPELKKQADARAKAAAAAVAADEVRLANAVKAKAVAEAEAKARAKAAADQAALEEAQARAAAKAQATLQAKAKAQQDAEDKAALAAIADAKERAVAQQKLEAQRKVEAAKKAEADRLAEEAKKAKAQQKAEAERVKQAADQARVETERLKAQADLKKAKEAQAQADAERAQADKAAAAEAAKVKAAADATKTNTEAAQAKEPTAKANESAAEKAARTKAEKEKADKEELAAAEKAKAKKEADEEAVDAEAKRVAGQSKLKQIEAKLSPFLNLSGGGRAVNFYSENGKIKDSSALPKSGPGFQRLKNNDAFYGTGMMISLITNLAGEFISKYFPGTKIYLGDISEKGGGRLVGTAHRSHQNGLDADIAFVGNTSFRSMTKNNQITSDFDYAKNWQFWRLVASQQIMHDKVRKSVLVQIYVNPAIKQGMCRWAKAHNLLSNPFDAELMRRLRSWSGHNKHFHLRIRCSPYYPDCRDQGDPKAGTGC